VVRPANGGEKENLTMTTSDRSGLRNAVVNELVDAWHAVNRAPPQRCDPLGLLQAGGERRRGLCCLGGVLRVTPLEMRRRWAGYTRRGERLPRHQGEKTLAVLPAADADEGERPSAARVARLLAGLPRPERRLLGLYLQENGNATAVARRLRVAPPTARHRLQVAFEHAREAEPV
jgi:hypothetical protein